MEEDLANELGKKLQEKELEAEELKNMLIKSEFEKKNLINGFEVQLEEESNKIQVLLEENHRLEDGNEVFNKEIFVLKSENERLLKFKPKDDDTDLTFEELVCKYKELSQEKERTETEFANLKEGAINTILEKEREIEELRSKFSSEAIEDLLREREDNKNKLFLIEQELEKGMTENEEKSRSLDREIASQVAYKLQEHEERSKNHEKNLIDELRRSDEKILNIEAQTKELLSKIKSLEDQNQSLLTVKSLKEGEITSEEYEKQIKNYEKQVEEVRKESIEGVLAKEEIIKRLEQELGDLQRKNEGYDKENKRLSDNRNSLKAKIEGLEEKHLEMQKEFELRLFEREKILFEENTALKDEIHELKEELTNANKPINKVLAPSCNNLMDLKEDLDVFNFTNDNGLAIPSSHLLGLVDEKEKNKKVEELMAEIKVLKEEEIVNLKKELDREKNDFQCYREIKENEKEAFIKEKEELLKILIEKDSLINQKEAFINEKEAFIREKEALIKEIDSFIKEKDSIIIEKDSLINEKDSIIKLKDSIIIEKKVLIKEKEFFIKDLQSKTDSFDNNLQELKTSHENALQSLQNSSKPSNEIPLIELEQEKLRLEQLIDSNKRSFLEEKSIFENELKITEKEAVEAKMKYAQVSMDKEYYQMKYHQLVKEIQKRNITDIIF